MNLNTILAPIIDKFKSKNPKIYLGTVATLLAIYVGLDVYDGEGLANILKYIDLGFLALTGSRTVVFLKDKTEVSAQSIDPNYGD